MYVNFNLIESKVQPVDGDSLLMPQTLAKIVRAVLEAVREQEEQRMLVRTEQRISDRLFDDHIQEWT